MFGTAGLELTNERMTLPVAQAPWCLHRARAMSALGGGLRLLGR